MLACSERHTRNIDLAGGEGSFSVLDVERVERCCELLDGLSPCPPDHMDETIVPIGDVHPHRRFVGRRIRKTFDDVGNKNESAAARTFEGSVESYMEKRQLFKSSLRETAT